MSKVILTVAVFLALAPALNAKDDPAAQQSLDAVLAQHNFLPALDAPFAMEADFTGQANVPTPGRFILRWQSANHWWSRVEFGPFEQIMIRNGNAQYFARNAPFTPFQVVELFHLFELGWQMQPLEATKTMTRVEAGTPLTCWKARALQPEKQNHELCAVSASRDLVSDVWQVGMDQSRRRLFEDYVQLGRLRYPRTLEMFINSSVMLSVHIQAMGAAPFDPSFLVPPKDAVVREKCDNLRPPVPIRKKSISLGRRSRRNLDSMVALTILADGSVGDAQVILRGGSLLDGPAVASLKKWKFAPAMCGDHPVVEDILADVDYHAVGTSRGRFAYALIGGAVDVRFSDWVN